jgi:phage tail-like protein
LDDVEGEIVHREGSQGERTTDYWLRAIAGDVKIDGNALPARKSVVVQLALGQTIQVGRHYRLTVVRGMADGQQAGKDAPAAWDLPGSTPVPPLLPALIPYLAASRLFIHYLPELYRAEETAGPEAPDLLARFLALFESVFLPLQWTVHHYDLCLHPESAPPDLLPWLADWYGLPVVLGALPEARRRELLGRLPELVARKGTAAGLHDLMEIVAGEPLHIVEDERKHFFTVELAGAPGGDAVRSSLCALIEWYKPVHTQFEVT